MPATGDPCRNCEGGIAFKQTLRRVVRLTVTSEMGEGGRKAAVSSRKGGVLTLGLFPCLDRLVKSTKLDKGLPNASKRRVLPRVYRAHANGAFKAPDCFLRQRRKVIDPASTVPCVKRILVERDRPVSHFDLGFTIADHKRRGQGSRC